MFGQDALGVAPGARGRAVDGRIGIEDAAPIGVERLRAFVRRQDAEEIFAEAGIEARQRFEKRAFKFGAGAEKRRAQHDAADALGMRLRIGQRQRRAPGAADHHPALEAEFLADHLHVRDQMRQRVVLAAALGAAAAGAALVEQHGVEALGIEQRGDDRAGSRCRGRHADRPRGCRRRGRRFRHRSRGRRRPAAAPRSAARTDRRDADDLPGVGVRRHDRRPSPACRPRNCDR